MANVSLVVESTSMVVESTSMSIWLFLGVLTLALLIGYGLGVGTGVAFGKGAGGKPWWYDVAFPSPDETTLGAMKALSDRFALGEIDAAEYQERIMALRSASETAEQRKARMEREGK